MANASTASRSSASVMSDGLAQRALTVAATISSVAGVTLPCSSAITIAPFSSAGLEGSDSARRRACSRSSRLSTENSSSPTVAVSPPVPEGAVPEGALLEDALEDAALEPVVPEPAVEPVVPEGADRPRPVRAGPVWARRASASASGSRSRRFAKDVLLSPRIRIPPTIAVPGLGRSSPGRPRPNPAVLLKLIEEPVDHAALPGLVLERLAHDAAGQVGSQGPHLGPQRGQRLLALGLDLRVRGLGQAPRLGLGLAAHLGNYLSALLLRLLAETCGVVAGLGELLAVLLQGPGRLRLGLLGTLQTALDLVGALLQGLLDSRQEELAERPEDDEERDRPDDELGERGNQGVL